MCQDSNPITLPTIPNMCFVPIENLYLHEYFDNTRHHPLAQRIEQEGVLRNPPIVARMNTDGNKFLILDGANRITALRSLGILHVPSQIVNPEDPGVSLQKWNHIVWQIEPNDLLSAIREVTDLKLYPFERVNHPNTDPETLLVQVFLSNGKNYAVSSKNLDLVQRWNLLNAIVDRYIHRAFVDRTCFHDVESLNGDYPKLGGLIVFPSVSIRDIFQITYAGKFLPSGITRFIISPRVTRINYPLSKMDNGKPLELKNNELREWVRASFSRKRVRYYPEATLVFDE